MSKTECAYRYCDYNETGICFLSQCVRHQAESGAPGCTNCWKREVWESFRQRTLTQAQEHCPQIDQVAATFEEVEPTINFIEDQS